MDEFTEMEDSRAIIKNKLRQYFDGRIVRKDLSVSQRKHFMAALNSNRLSSRCRRENLVILYLLGAAACLRPLFLLCVNVKSYDYPKSKL